MFSLFRYIIFTLTVSIVAPKYTKSTCPICLPCDVAPINCTKLDYENLVSERISTVLSILLFVSEILPFIASVRANGIAQAIHTYLFHRQPEPTTVHVSRSSVDYGSI